MLAAPDLLVFAAELPTMEETREEYDKGRAAALKKGEAYGSVEP